ncbi:MAG: hypothetical protein ABFS17_06995, partial [Chloroflexota bacterium]
MQKAFQFLILIITGLLLVTACSPPPPQSDDILGSLIPPTNPVSATTLTPTELIIPPTLTLEPKATEVPFTTIVFTGVIVPARCVQAKVDEVGSADYIYDGV